MLGAALGSIGGGALGLSPSISGAVGGGLGGVLGNEFAGHGGVGGDILEGGLGALGGYLAGDTLSGWAGNAPTSPAGAAPPGSQWLPSVTGAAPGQGAMVAGGIPAAGVAGAAGGAGGAVAGPGGLMGFLQDNPAIMAAGLGVAGQALSPELSGMMAPDYPAAGKIQENADLMNRIGASGARGNLTPASSVALNDAIAEIKSSYANMGLSGSTMEAQDLAAAKERAVSASVQEGLQELGLSTSLYDRILGYQMQNDQELSGAITSLMGQIGMAAGT